MEIGVDSFAAILPDPETGRDPLGERPHGQPARGGRGRRPRRPRRVRDRRASSGGAPRLCAPDHPRGGGGPDPADPADERGDRHQRRRPRARLPGGIHAIGFVAETDREARDAFFPGWKQIMAKVGRERGCAPPSREQFESLADPDGAYLIGAPETVAAKMLRARETFGGLSRITFQMTASLDPAVMKRSIALLGAAVAPIIRASHG